MHFNYKVLSYWSKCPYYVSAMGNLITQKNTLNSNRATNATALYKSPCSIKSLITLAIFHMTRNISDNTKHSFAVWCNCLICHPHNFAVCILIAGGNFPWINIIWLGSTDNQWQANTAVTVWQMQWKVRSNTHACTWCNDEYL